MKLLKIFQKFILFSSFVTMLIICSCQSSTLPTTEVEPAITATEYVNPTNTQTLTATPLPSPTATSEPTLTPTSTPLPELALVGDTLSMWSIPNDVFIMLSESGISKETYSITYDGFLEETELNVRVPASAVVVEVEFNQPVNDDVFLNIYDLYGSAAWYSEKLILRPENPSKGYALLDHNFVLDPPAWEITYAAKLESADGDVFWENDLRLYKALPNTCWDGSLPHPVTFACPNYDGDWNYRDFPNFNPNADIFTSGEVYLDDEYKD